MTEVIRIESTDPNLITACIKLGKASNLPYPIETIEMHKTQDWLRVIVHYEGGQHAGGMEWNRRRGYLTASGDLTDFSLTTVLDPLHTDSKNIRTTMKTICPMLPENSWLKVSGINRRHAL